MKYVDEFRDGDLARTIAARIAQEADPGRTYHFMEFCGGHTHAISRYGVKDLLPPNVVMVHGPGCPVCVLPIGRIDMAIELALGGPDPSSPTLLPGGEGRKVLPSPLGEGSGVRVGRPQASRISKSEVTSAVLASMIVAEQYFSFESLMARSTCAGLRPRPVTM